MKIIYISELQNGCSSNLVFKFSRRWITVVHESSICKIKIKLRSHKSTAPRQAKVGKNLMINTLICSTPASNGAAATPRWKICFLRNILFSYQNTRIRLHNFIKFYQIPRDQAPAPDIGQNKWCTRRPPDTKNSKSKIVYTNRQGSTRFDLLETCFMTQPQK